jgi:hypothetical protein
MPKGKEKDNRKRKKEFGDLIKQINTEIIQI